MLIRALVPIAPAGLKDAAGDGPAELKGRLGIGAGTVLAGPHISPFEPDHRFRTLGEAAPFVRRGGQRAGLRAVDVHALCANVLARILLGMGNEGVKGNQIGVAAAIALSTGQEKYAQCNHRGQDVRAGHSVSHHIVFLLVADDSPPNRVVGSLFWIKDVVRGLFLNPFH
jgi:hypothetical protein